MLTNFLLIFTLIMVASSYEPEDDDDDYFEDEIGPSRYENLKMTDVLKMVVLPSAQEITNILTSEDNTTGEPANPQKLEFILHAIDYWRKHNIPEDLVDIKGENITKVTFNLRDDFFDDDGSQYSRLSKKLHDQHIKDSTPRIPSTDITMNLDIFKERGTPPPTPPPFVRIPTDTWNWNKFPQIQRQLPLLKQLRTVFTKAPIPKVPDDWTKGPDIKRSIPEHKQIRTIFRKTVIPKIPDSWKKDADIKKKSNIEKRSAPMPYKYVKNL